MEVNELLQMLRDKQLDDAMIKDLLSQALAQLDVPGEGEADVPPAETEDEKFSRVFGY